MVDLGDWLDLLLLLVAHGIGLLVFEGLLDAVVGWISAIGFDELCLEVGDCDCVGGIATCKIRCDVSTISSDLDDFGKNVDLLSTRVGVMWDGNNGSDGVFHSDKVSAE